VNNLTVGYRPVPLEQLPKRKLNGREGRTAINGLPLLWTGSSSIAWTQKMIYGCMTRTEVAVSGCLWRADDLIRLRVLCTLLLNVLWLTQSTAYFNEVGERLAYRCVV
jgi:hypothetical protein